MTPSAEEDEECDYMSDKFITTTIPQSSSLLKARSFQRQIDVEEKARQLRQTQKKNSVKAISAENLVTGLQTQLDSSNRGFALLMKMGYKPGEGLGPQGEGRVEPIHLEVKNDRQGLGVAGERKRRIDTFSKESKKRSHQLEHMPEQFRASRAEQFQLRECAGHLKSAQRVCYNMDTEALGLVNGPRSGDLSFWPVECRPKPDDDAKQHDEEDEDTEDVEENPGELLAALTRYLRETHCYCFWCGSAFTNADDMGKNCPGPDKSDHD